MNEMFRLSCIGAVSSGVGIAGCHGGMCDSFRTNTEWQFCTGSQWVAHPGNDGVRYTVKIGPNKSPITEGIKDFEVASEQYYLHVDPANRLVADSLEADHGDRRGRGLHVHQAPGHLAGAHEVLRPGARLLQLTRPSGEHRRGRAASHDHAARIRLGGKVKRQCEAIECLSHPVIESLSSITH